MGLRNLHLLNLALIPDTSQGQFGLLPERGNQGGATLHRAQPVTRAAGKRPEGACAEVAELVLLQVSPDVFRRIELGSVGRQVLQLNGAVETLDVVAHQLTAMRGQPVPDHQHLAADVSTQGVQELDDLRSLDRSREESKVE